MFCGGFFPSNNNTSAQRINNEETIVAMASIYNEAPSLFKTFPFPLPLPFFESALISERKAMLFSDFAPPPPVVLDFKSLNDRASSQILFLVNIISRSSSISRRDRASASTLRSP
jgi:hypothetical protein